ncbi:hypothetical protein [Streptomyces sp. WM6386]|uniref:hypothetical protein n=1 Tax=Streptomyces sp. WM6386 TaxID=1415558 RepID=UPI000619E535|nr:hypothetical protein [Streptomyces sp. WM6386]
MPDGHKTLNLLAAHMARTPGDLLRIPALCLTQAESEDADAARRVLGFSSVVVDPLDMVSSVGVGTMIRDGYGGADTCHALYCALPRYRRARLWRPLARDPKLDAHVTELQHRAAEATDIAEAKALLDEVAKIRYLMRKLEPGE